MTYPGLASWAKFRRPYGTGVGKLSFHADSLAYNFEERALRRNQISCFSAITLRT